MCTRTARLLLATLFALPACGAERDFGDEDSVASVDAGDEGEPLDEETEEPPAGDEGEEPTPPPELLMACDLPYPCEFPVELVRESGSDGYADSDLCVLAALAQGTPGLVQTLAVFNKAESYLDHVVIEPGQVLRQAHGRSDGLGLWQKSVERCSLKGAEFFVACAQDFDPECLNPQSWVDDCEELDSLTCPQA